MNKTPSYPPPYTVTDGCLYQEIMQGKNKLTKKLCNFVPYLIAEVVHDDGAELKRFYRIGAAHADGYPLADSPKNSLDRNSTDLKWILPQFGAYDLKRLTPQMLSGFHSNIKAETNLAFTSREHIHRTLCTMLSSAVAQGYLKLNPAFHTFPYEKKTAKAPMVSLEQLRKFIRCLDDALPKHALFYKLLLATGIKRAECVGLKWSDVDYSCGEIAINKIVISVPHEPVLVKSVPPRTVYLSANMCALLQSIQKKKVDRYIFEQSKGLPMLPSTFTYRLKLICQKCGLPVNLTMQTIYTTHAKLLKQHGSTDKKAYLKLQRKLGL